MSAPNLWLRVLTLELVAYFAADREACGVSRRSIDDAAKWASVSCKLVYRLVKEASFLGIARSIPGRRVVLSVALSALEAPFEWRSVAVLVPPDAVGRKRDAHALLLRARAVVATERSVCDA